jgi:MULE transposase domain
MPFLHIVGVSNTNQHFKLAYYFLPGKTEPNYNFAIQHLYLLYARYHVKPKAIVTDKEQALKNALRTYFPGVPQLLCLWHVAKNVLTHV